MGFLRLSKGPHVIARSLDHFEERSDEAIHEKKSFIIYINNNFTWRSGAVRSFKNRSCNL